MTIPSGYIIMLISLPMPWPPRKITVLTKQEMNGCTVDLLADQNGCLGFSVSHRGQTRLHMFQRIRLSDQGMAIIDFGWSDERAFMGFQRTELAEDAAGDAPTHYFDMSAAPRRPLQTHIYGNVDPAHASNLETRFFLETIADIDQKVVSGDRYHLIRAAGLLRQLLLDGSPLLFVANREYRLKLKFTVMAPYQRPPHSTDLLSSWQNLDPSAFPNGQIVDVDLSEFLRANVLWHNNTWATVKDVIKACANAKGGIHFGRPDGTKQEVVLKFDQENDSLAGEPSLVALSGLCRVVLKGVRPLVSAICAGRVVSAPPVLFLTGLAALALLS